MAGAPWYRTGTVTVSNGSAAVVGVQSLWSSKGFPIVQGDIFYGPDGKPYEVKNVDSDTALTLQTPYQGPNAAAQSYAIQQNYTGNTTADLAAQLAALFAKYGKTMDQFNSWLVGSGAVTVLDSLGNSKSIPSAQSISMLALAANGYLSKSIKSGAASLSVAEAANGVIDFTGALDGAAIQVVPSAPAYWLMSNMTSGAFSLTIKTATGSGVVVPQGSQIVLKCDGNTVRPALDLAALGTGTAASKNVGNGAGQIPIADADGSIVLAGSLTIGSGAANKVNISGAAGDVVVSVSGLSTDSGVVLRAKGGGWITSQMNGATQFSVAGPTNAVNSLQATGAQTGGAPVLQAWGSDANIGISYVARGSGNHVFYNPLKAYSTQFALCAANTGTAQTSIGWKREGAKLNEKSWEAMVDAGGNWLLRTISDDYSSSVSAIQANRGTGTAVNELVLLPGAGSVLIGGASSDGASRLVVNGAIKCSGPVSSGSYTRSTVPNASAFSGATIYVTDAAGGTATAWSNGASWISNLTKNVI